MTNHTATPKEFSILCQEAWETALNATQLDEEFIGILYESLKGRLNSHLALVEALRQARIALTPHVFIDDDARKARNKADEALKLEGEA
jgi:hypothetical protein